MTLPLCNPNSCDECAALLRNGAVVIIPTDTVYGFSATAQDIASQNDEGARAIRALKGRGENKPFITLIAHSNDIFRYTNAHISERLLSLWPAPLTIIVELAQSNSALCKNTAAFRCPADAWLRSVIEKCGSPIYSTSVNRSGKPPLMAISDIEAQFQDQVPLIIDGGERVHSIPSTIVDATGITPKILRQGEVTIDCRSLLSSPIVH